MIDFVFLVPICSFVCLGIHALTRRGNIFGFWSFATLDEEEENRFALADPLSECLICMSSLYGALTLAVHYGAEPLISLLPLLVLTFIFVACQVVFERKAFVLLQKFSYLTTIVFFFATSLQNNFIHSVVFLMCVSGMNYFVSLLIGLIESNIETNTNRNQNAVNQPEALQRIIEVISAKEETKEGQSFDEFKKSHK